MRNTDSAGSVDKQLEQDAWEPVYVKQSGNKNRYKCTMRPDVNISTWNDMSNRKQATKLWNIYTARRIILITHAYCIRVMKLVNHQ